MNVLLLTASLAVAAFGGEGGQQPANIPEMWDAWCARCHAHDGTGKIAEPTVTVTPMDFTDCKLTTPEPDADLERAIAKGGPGVGLSPQMPARYERGAQHLDARLELNGENHEVSQTPQVRKGLAGTGALAMSIGAMVPINKREERGVRWVGYLLSEFLEPLRARK